MISNKFYINIVLCAKDKAFCASISFRTEPDLCLSAENDRQKEHRKKSLKINFLR